MNQWIVVFTDIQDMSERREQLFPAHLEYLHARTEMFIDGCPLLADQNQVPSGGLWVLKARSRDEILELINGDPMFHPEYRAFQIYALGKPIKVE